MKAQAEVVIVLGIVLVAIITVFYMLKGGITQTPVPEDVYKQQREVAESVKNVIRDATDKTLKAMMTHGGYLEERVPGVSVTYNDVDCVDFLFTGVPYWQRCGTTMYPDISDVRQWMERSIENMIRNGTGGVEEQYGGRVAFDKDRLRVVVDIKGDDSFEPDVIDVTAYLPTTVRGYRIPDNEYPYKVTFKTQFGRMYAFGRDFADASAEKRYFDVFTIAAIYLSNELENTHTKLPTAGVMTQCGEVLYRSPQEINNYLMEILEYLMSSVAWWKPMRQESQNPKEFAIHDVMGRTYKTLDIKTLLTDSWVFNLADFVFATNFKMPTNGGYTVPICTASYNHAYNFRYPFVLRIRDRYTGYSFNIASEVSVRDRGDGTMEPGECDASGASSPECTHLGCHGRVRVVDHEGEPVRNAWVVFAGCPVGETGEDGYAEADIKCGTGELGVYQNPDKEFFKRSLSSTTLEGTYTVTLNPVRDIRVHFRDVDIKRTGYRYFGDEAFIEECDACSDNCMIEKEILQQCSIGLIDREYAIATMNNGYTKLPVTNIDSDNMPGGCTDTDDCRFCSEHSNESETSASGIREEILDACRRCAQGCYTTPLESSVVDYIPSGYTYSIEGRMYDAMNDYLISGVLSYAGFSVEANTTDIYIYMPERADDRVNYIDAAVDNNEVSCLMEAMRNCGIDAASPREYPSTIVVMPEGECSCAYMESIIRSCVGSVPDMFCECPSGNSYPSGCGRSCGGLFDEPCTRCCNKEAVLNYLKTLEQSCQIRVICKGIND